jgi:tape measure domain-containing protein
MPPRFNIETAYKAVDQSTRTIGKIQNRLMKLTARGSMAMRRLDRTMSRVSKTLTKGIRRGAFLAVAGITTLAGATWKVMQQFSKIEDAEAAFTPLLGGAKKATEMVKALNDAAATTPFQFENLAGAAKQLLPNMGGDITRTIELIRMLGDTAGGNAQNMDSIVRGYNKALLKGKVDMESLNMIAEAGVPIFNDLGAVVGKSGTKLFKAISAGKISTEDLTKAFQKMTGKGGIFFEGMKIASETLSGKVSTLKDNVGLAAAEFGTVLAPVLKDTTDYLIDVSKQAKQWIIQNKAIIRTKLDEFIKKIPEYLEKIVYWGPKIAYLVGTFYAITGAVKVTNTAMTLFNTLANINLGPLKAVGAFMGKTLPMKIGASTTAVGIFQTALIGLGAFVAGWAIGTILHEKLVEPFMKARHQAKMLRAEHEHTMSGDLAKRNEAVLEGDLTRVNKLIAAEEKALHGRRRNRSYISGMASMYGGSTDILDPAEATLRNLRSDRARLLQARNIARYSGGDPVSDEWNIVTHQGTSTTKEEVEITIKDETTGKRATVTKGSSGRLKLAHTGGMP